MDQRISAGVDLYRKQSDASKYTLYQNWVTGGTVRVGLPITDRFSISGRYSLYSSQIKIPNTATQPYDDCTSDGTSNIGAFSGVGTSTTNCLTNGEASLAVKEIRGTTITSLGGYTLAYNNLDDTKNPSNGYYAEVKQDVAGLGGNSHFVKTTGQARYYHELYDNFVGFVKVQGGNVFGYGSKELRLVDNFNLGPDLVRGFAPSGIGPRDISSGTNSSTNGLGGTNYVGGTAEIQFPIFGMPREMGLKAAIFADAGTLFGYTGQTNFGTGACVPSGSPNYTQATCIDLGNTTKPVIRSSVGASLIWASPLGPIRFDYAFVLSKAEYDVKQAFRFTGGASF